MSIRSVLLLCTVIFTAFCGTVGAQPATKPDAPLTLGSVLFLPGHREQVDELTFSPDGEILASSSSKENTTRLRRTADGRLHAVLEGAMRGFSPNGQLLLTAKGKNAKLWETATGKLKFALNEHEDSITSATFSPDGNKIALGSKDGTATLWDARNGQPTARLLIWEVKKIARWRVVARAFHVPVLVNVSFSPDGRNLLTYTELESSSAKLWNATTGSLLAQLGGHTREVGNGWFGATYLTESDPIRQASFSPDGKFVLTSSYQSIRLWNAVTGEFIKEFDGWNSASFSPNSKYLGFPLHDINKGLGLVNLETMEMRNIAGIDLAFFNQFECSADSRTCVFGSGYAKYNATLIDLETGRIKAAIPLVSKLEFGFEESQKDLDLLSFYPDSRFLLGANHKSVKIWNALTGQLIIEKTEGRDPARFSANGKWFAAVGIDKKTVLLWQVAGK